MKTTLLNHIDDGNDAYNDFYASVSMLFRIASFILLIAFLIFIVYSAFGSQEAFTHKNLEYLARNFALTLEENRDQSVYAIKYNPDSSRNFALLGNKLALCGNSGISIFSSTGRLTCSDSFSFKNPVMVASEKYALVYDSGNYDLIVYNSFTRVHSQTLEKPIRGACMSQNGYYSIITSSDEYNSTVEVYNDDFELINRFNKSGYVVGIDMYDNQILITTIQGSAGNSSFDLQLLVYDIAEEKTLSSIVITTSFPLSCKLSSSGFFLICKNEAITFDIVTDNHNRYSYNGLILSDFDLSYYKAALILEAPGYDISFKHIVLDDHSSVIYDYSICSTVYDVELCGEYSCLLTDNKLHVYNSIAERIITLDSITTDCCLIACDRDALYLCSSSSAPLINIDK